MSKFCIKCGTKLAKDDLFCCNCGAKQETVEVSIEHRAEKDVPNISLDDAILESTPESKTAVPISDKTKRGKKPIIWVAISMVVVCIVAIFAISLLGNRKDNSKDISKGLIAVDEIEQKLNEAFNKVLEGHNVDFDGVTEFKIENVDEENYNQTFSCFVTSSDDGVSGLRVMGLVKDGQVIQLQSIGVVLGNDSDELDTDVQDMLLVLGAFPVSIFRDDVDTAEKINDFIQSMDFVSDGISEVEKIRTVDGDIEYTYMGETGNGIIIYSFNIRYLPAFSTGFFEDEDNDIISDDTFFDDELTQNDSSAESGSLVSNVKLGKFEAKETDEYGAPLVSLVVYGITEDGYILFGPLFYGDAAGEGFDCITKLDKDTACFDCNGYKGELVLNNDKVVLQMSEIPSWLTGLQLGAYELYFCAGFEEMDGGPVMDPWAGYEPYTIFSTFLEDYYSFEGYIGWYYISSITGLFSDNTTDLYRIDFEDHSDYYVVDCAYDSQGNIKSSTYDIKKIVNGGLEYVTTVKP